MAKQRVFYNCLKCPAYCCTYPRIAVKKRDAERLAKHFGISVAQAYKRFTKKGHDEGEIVLRHKEDEYFGTSCRFLDSETRQCTIYKARPQICRDFPGTGRCGYYDFLCFERDLLEDPDYVSTTNNT